MLYEKIPTGIDISVFHVTLSLSVHVELWERCLGQCSHLCAGLENRGLNFPSLIVSILAFE